jgi:hypothetical protein
VDHLEVLVHLDLLVQVGLVGHPDRLDLLVHRVQVESVVQVVHPVVQDLLVPVDLVVHRVAQDLQDHQVQVESVVQVGLLVQVVLVDLQDPLVVQVRVEPVVHLDLLVQVVLVDLVVHQDLVEQAV